MLQGIYFLNNYNAFFIYDLIIIFSVIFALLGRRKYANRNAFKTFDVLVDVVLIGVNWPLLLLRWAPNFFPSPALLMYLIISTMLMCLMSLAAKIIFKKIAICLRETNQIIKRAFNKNSANIQNEGDIQTLWTKIREKVKSNKLVSTLNLTLLLIIIISIGFCLTSFSLFLLGLINLTLFSLIFYFSIRMTKPSHHDNSTLIIEYIIGQNKSLQISLLLIRISINTLTFYILGPFIINSLGIGLALKSLGFSSAHINFSTNLFYWIFLYYLVDDICSGLVRSKISELERNSAYVNFLEFFKYWKAYRQSLINDNINIDLLNQNMQDAIGIIKYETREPPTITTQEEATYSPVVDLSERENQTQNLSIVTESPLLDHPSETENSENFGSIKNQNM